VEWWGWLLVWCFLECGVGGGVFLWVFGVACGEFVIFFVG